MKPFILFALLFINSISLSQSFWSKIETLYGASGSSFAVDTSGIIYFANADIFRSDNNAANWIKINGPTVSSNKIFCINEVLYVSANEGLFKSTDYGKNWLNILSSTFIQFFKAWKMSKSSSAANLST